MATKKAALARPTREYLEGLVSEQQRNYQSQNDQIDRMRSLREQTDPILVDPKWKLVDFEVHDPTIADEAFRVAATLSVNPATMKVIPLRLGDAPQKNASLREHWTEAALNQAGGRGVVPTYKRMVDAVVNDGAGWTKVVATLDRWETRYALRIEDFMPDEELDESEEAGKAQGKRKKKVDVPAEGEEARQAVGDAGPVESEDVADNAVETPDDQPIDREGFDPAVQKDRARFDAMKKYNAASEEAKKAAGVPFDWLYVDAKAVYPVWHHEVTGEILEVSDRPRLASMRQFRLGTNKQGEIVPEELAAGQDARSKNRLLGDTVKLIEHWDSEWVTYMIVGEREKGGKTSHILKQWQHGYGQVPYFMAPGMWMAHFANRKIGYAIGETKASLVQYSSFLMTIDAQVTARDAVPPIARNKPNTGIASVGDDAKPRAQDSIWKLATIYDLEPGETLAPVQFPQLTQLKQHMGMVHDQIDRLTTPRVKNEIGTGLEGAGFAINQLLAEAKIRHDPCAQGIEQALEKITRFVWHLVRTKIREAVWVHRQGEKQGGWIAAGPTDLTDGVQMTWTVNAEMPSAKIIENRYWNERLQAGTASLDQAIDAQGDNPDEVRKGKAEDRIRNEDWYKRYEDACVLAEMGRGDLLMAQAEQMASSGAVPAPGGGPGAGPGGPPGAGGMPGAAGPTAPPGQPGGGSPPGVSFGAHPPGGVSGVGAGAVVPAQAAAAGVQRMAG